jgi:hypothetical protein
MGLRFLENETGAVTVDWVVLTAATVGLGLATMSLVSEGLRDASEDTAALLHSDLITTRFGAAFTAVTEAFTADAVLAPGSLFAELRGADRYSFRMEATLNASDEGILFEAGGRGRGTILYQHDGVLYLQAGDGGGIGEATNRGEAVWTVADGSYTIEGSLDASTGLALYIDGQLVSQSSFSHWQLSGGNEGTVGDGNNGVA